MLYAISSSLTRAQSWTGLFCSLEQSEFTRRNNADIRIEFLTSSLHLRLLLKFPFIIDNNNAISRLKKSNEMQQYAGIYLLLNYSTCFGRPSRPSSGVHKTVLAASGTDHIVWGASFLIRDHTWSLLRKLAPQRLQVQFYVLLMMGAMDLRNL